MDYQYYVDDYGSVYRVDENDVWTTYHFKLKDWISAEGFQFDIEAWTRITEEEVEPYLDR